MGALKMKSIPCVLTAIVTGFFCASAALAEPHTVSPLLAGANLQFNDCGFYYGSLPADAPESRRAEFADLMKQIGIGVLRYPGGWFAHEFIPDNDQAMLEVQQFALWPQSDKKVYPDIWRWLDFCKQTNIEPLFQVNTLLYFADGKMYRLTEGASDRRGAKEATPDPSKRSAAADALAQLVKKTTQRGYAVRHWELGNEEYSGYPAADYADVAIQFTNAIRQADPNAIIWITLGDNSLRDPKSDFYKWAQTVLAACRDAGLNKDPNVRFTLHYSWRAIVDAADKLVRQYGFQPRFAITEFHMAGTGPYWDLSPRFGYALDLAKYLIEMAADPRVEILCIHDLDSQNFGIIHYNQRSYGLPGMQTWDESLGYQLMPSARTYELFSRTVGGQVIPQASDPNRLVVEKDGHRVIFVVNHTVNPMTVEWGPQIVGKGSAKFTRHTITPADKSKDDPRRVDQTAEETQQGAIANGRLTVELPSMSVSAVICTR